MASAATVTAFIMDGQNISSIICLSYLIVAGNALGAGGDFAQSDVINRTMAALVVVMTDDAGGRGSVIFSGCDGIDDCSLQGKAVAVGLGGGVIVVTEITGVSCDPAME